MGLENLLKNPFKFVANSSKETQEFAFEFAKIIKPFCLIALIGELGAGKTTFVSGFAKYFGVQEAVFSPTFTTINEYFYNKTEKIVHCDAYRLETEEEIYNTEFFDLLADKNNIILVEWADKLLNFLSNDYFKISFKNLEDNKREITVAKGGF